MSHVTEHGYANRVANFKRLIDVCISLGARYNPPKASLQVVELQRLHSTATVLLQTVDSAHVAYQRVAHARVLAFKRLSPLASRVILSLASSDALRQTVSDARSFKAKIDGKRITRLPVADANVVAEGTKPVKRRSVSQRSYSMLIEYFSNLYSLVSKDSFYAPNEPELQVQSLAAFVSHLRETNDAVSRAALELSAARLARERLLYNEGTGLHDVALAVKAYVASVFGKGSEEARAVSSIIVK